MVWSSTSAIACDVYLALGRFAAGLGESAYAEPIGRRGAADFPTDELRCVRFRGCAPVVGDTTFQLGFIAGGWMGVALLYTDSKSIDFSTNGMETGFMHLFLRLLAVGTWAFNDAKRSGSRAGSGSLFYSKRVRAVRSFHLPWFLTAWVYYGSPVPHAIVAKASASSVSWSVSSLVKTHVRTGWSQGLIKLARLFDTKDWTCWGRAEFR